MHLFSLTEIMHAAVFQSHHRHHRDGINWVKRKAKKQKGILAQTFKG